VGRRKGPYFEHEDKKVDWFLQRITLLVGEWLFFWATFWLKVFPGRIGKWLKVKLFEDKQP
jgi:hypothetical protein